MKRIASAACAFAAVVASPWVLPSPATAADQQHCWVNVTTGASACFATLQGVLDDLRGGEVVGYESPALALSGSGPAASPAQAAPPSVSVAASYPMATVFEDTSYGGSSTTFTSSGVCDTSADVDWQLANVGSAWNDRISSFKSYSDCQTKLFENASYGGAAYGPVTNSTTVGTMNDKATSIRWS